MGKSKREELNYNLLRSADYTNLYVLKRLIATINIIINLAESGDQVAMSILIDLKTVLGEYQREESPLTDRQIFALRMSLIEGYSQAEVAAVLGVTQKWVSKIILLGLEAIRKQLCREAGHGDT